MGLSRQALQQRVRRKTVESRHDNTGSPQVFVSGASRETSHATPEPDVAPVAAGLQQAVPVAAGLVSLADVRIMLGEQREALQAAHRDAMAMMTERVDSAECRAEAAEARAAVIEDKLHQILDHLLKRPPWWAVWR